LPFTRKNEKRRRLIDCLGFGIILNIFSAKGLLYAPTKAPVDVFKKRNPFS